MPNSAPYHPRDPIGWCAAIALAFLALAWIRLGIPSKPYFDEIHYLPAARALIAGTDWLNREHPPFGKEVLAAGIALFGDTAFAWRLPSTLMGTLTLFGAMRAMWFASTRRLATVLFGVLLATGFILFIESRIAMLDATMVAMVTLAFWQCAAAMREPEHGRVRLAVAGIALGLALATKWNAIPLAPIPGLAFLFVRLRGGGWRGLVNHRGAPVPGIRLAEAALWLGVVPLAVYALTFVPLWQVDPAEFGSRGFFGVQQMMLRMQESVVKPHPYMSNWDSWIVNRRAIWFLYEFADGAQRGIVLIGNPLTMLAALPAVLWCAWAGIVHRRVDALAVAVLFAAAFGFWIVAAKPVQFYYHYFLPSIPLLGALALALDAVWPLGWRKAVIAFMIADLAMFAWFYPIISAASLGDSRGYERWMWIDGWR